MSKHCVECGAECSAAHAEYQAGIGTDGKPITYTLCLPCDAGVPNLDDPRITPCLACGCWLSDHTPDETLWCEGQLHGWDQRRRTV